MASEYMTHFGEPAVYEDMSPKAVSKLRAKLAKKMYNFRSKGLNPNGIPLYYRGRSLRQDNG